MCAAIGSRSADLDLGVGGEGVRWDSEILRRRPDTDAAGGVILRAMAGTEPAAIVAPIIADGLPFRNAAEMRANADHHEPRLLAFRGAVLVGGGCVLGEVRV